MKILGISGFEGAIPFKRARWPHLDEREYRISQGHDSAAALIVDGAIVAAVADGGQGVSWYVTVPPDVQR